MNTLFLKIDQSALIGWSVGAVALIIAAYLVYRFFKSTEEKKETLVPVITRVFPDPSHGPITIELHGHASVLKILNAAGQPLGSFAVTEGDLHFDFSKMPRGKYFVVAYYGATESNKMPFTLQ